MSHLCFRKDDRLNDILYSFVCYIKFLFTILTIILFIDVNLFIMRFLSFTSTLYQVCLFLLNYSFFSHFLQKLSTCCYLSLKIVLLQFCQECCNGFGNKEDGLTQQSLQVKNTRNVSCLSVFVGLIFGCRGHIIGNK